MSLEQLLARCLEETVEPLLPDELRRLSAQLGFELPSPLARLYAFSRRGQFARRYLSGPEYEFEVHELLSGDPDDEQNVAAVYHDVVLDRGLLPEGLLPFAVGSGGDFYCVDLERLSVVFVPMDPPSSEPRFVAGSVEAFLGELAESLEDE